MPDTHAAMLQVFRALGDTLKAKNRAYGNSALEPLWLLTECDADQGILLRMEDKIKRWRSTGAADGEDTLLDLAGYAVLLQVARDIPAVGKITLRSVVDRIDGIIDANMYRAGSVACTFVHTGPSAPRSEAFASEEVSRHPQTPSAAPTPFWGPQEQGAVVDYLLANLYLVKPAMLAVELIRLYVILHPELTDGPGQPEKEDEAHAPHN